MARREDIDNSSDPFFITGRDTGSVQTQMVRGASVKIHRAASESMGKSVSVEFLDPNMVEDWVPDEVQLKGTEGGSMTGFARYAEMYGGQYGDQARFPIEASMGPISDVERKRIIEATDPNASMPDPRRRIHRDPDTYIPENVAEVDRLSESDSFFGKDKVEPETDAVLERMKHVDRVKESVDYKTSRAVPIKVIRRS